MIDGILTYLLIGFIWMAFWDILIEQMPNDETRMRYLIFWPVTLIAFLIGIYDAWKRHKDE
jgi:hypothetical protein